MKYRSLGNRVGEKVSALGFGCMRLPTFGSPAAIDEKTAEGMLGSAIEAGVNYVDTAYPYHGGQSEVFVGKALERGRRNKVFLATKLPTWLLKTPQDFDRLFEEQLVKLRTDRVDFYLFHALNTERWNTVLRLGGLDWAERKKKEGRIRYIGFSFHDVFTTFETIIGGYGDWDFCQIQYNFLNETYQAGTAGLKLAASRGIGVVVMEPLLGGGLAKPFPSVLDIWKKANASRSPADWAFRWLWDKDEVGTVLSGMSTPGQVEENLSIAEAAGNSRLGADERPLYAEAAKEYERLRPVPCTACEYCLPCPNGVDIPANFRIFNEAKLYEQPESGNFRYNQLKPEARASSCVACGVCLSKCPQHIAISDSLAEAAKALGT